MAARLAGLRSHPADVIRAGENTLVRLPGGVVARVTRKGQQRTAAKELRVSRWLAGAGVPVVSALDGQDTPVVIDGHAVTFWHELPPHRRGTAADVAEMLKVVHHLDVPPDLELPPLAPFVRIAERLREATWLDPADHDWLLERLATLTAEFDNLPLGMTYGAVHGDAWGGNVVITDRGPVLLDLERFAVGLPEWDLTSIAVDHFTFGTVTTADWRDACARYGYDVTEWLGFPVLRDVRELRKVSFAVQMVQQHPNAQKQAKYRIECVRGLHGSRPWHWRGVP